MGIAIIYFPVFDVINVEGEIKNKKDFSSFSKGFLVARNCLRLGNAPFKLAASTISDLVSNQPKFSIINFEQNYYKYCLSWKSLFRIF